MNWKIEKRKLGELIPFAENPRVKVEAGIKSLDNSLEEFGQVRTFVLNADGTIIGGNQMYSVLLEKYGKDHEVDCHIPDKQIPKRDMQRLNVKLNKIAAGDWDMEALQKYHDANDLLEDFAITELPFLDDVSSVLNGDDDYATDSLGNISPISNRPQPTLNANIPVYSAENPPPVFQDSEDVEVKTPEKIFVKFGDLFEIRANGCTYRFSCLDSTKEEDIKILMNGQVADMVFQDPPYNLSVKSLGSHALETSISHIHDEFAMASGEMTEDEFINFLQKIFYIACLYSKDGSIHYNCMDWRHLFEITVAVKKEYTELKNVCVWNKDNGGMGTFYRSKHEFIFVTKNGKGRHTNNFQLGQFGRFRTNVWNYPISSSFAAQEREGQYSVGNSELKLHPTPKPVQMMVDACLDCSNENENVLDLFCGSGSTALACLKAKRNCFTNEIEPKYVQRATNRMVLYCEKQGMEYEIYYNGEKVDKSIFNQD